MLITGIGHERGASFPRNAAFRACVKNIRADRLQTQLLPAALGYDVTPNTPALFIDAFVARLDAGQVGTVGKL